MGKERDKLLWQLGKKPNTMTNEEAHQEYMMRRVEEGNPPPRMKEILKKITKELEEKKE